MYRGEIWWVGFDPSLGSEIHKTRPAVIMSNDVANRHLSRITVIPLTGNVERLYPSETIVTIDGKPGKAMADQMTVADKQRFKARIGAVSRDEMRALEKVVADYLGIPR